MKYLFFMFVMMILSGPVLANALGSFLGISNFQLASGNTVPKDCLLLPRITSDIRVLNPELTRQKPYGLSNHHSSTGQLQGLADMKYGFDILFVFEGIQSHRGACVRIVSMDIKAGHDSPQIWLRPNLEKGSCEYNSVVEHELQHVRNYHDHLRRFKSSIGREFPILMRGKSYVGIDTMAGSSAAQEILKADGSRFVQQLHDRSAARAEALDRAMDTPEEYRRMSQRCR